MNKLWTDLNRPTSKPMQLQQQVGTYLCQQVTSELNEHQSRSLGSSRSDSSSSSSSSSLALARVTNHKFTISSCMEQNYVKMNEYYLANTSTDVVLCFYYQHIRVAFPQLLCCI